ncbi:MAG: UDP-N-acetylmuramoyl-L-alanine--D-glutamate ligase, partial [Thermaurantiacus sp.]
MIAAPSLSGKRFAVFGLARTGLATLRFLARSGAAASAWDERADARDAAAAALPGLSLENPMDRDFVELDGLLVSPGVPLDRHPLVARARAAGIPVLGDMELFQLAREALPPHRLVGVTGTNGKSTVTALLHHLLLAGGMLARMGGNIGAPVLDQAPLPAGGTYVLELSSFQIDLSATLACDIAIFTNLTPDHLDRYDGMAAYCAAKERLFAMQPQGGRAIVATDDAWTRDAFARLPPQVQGLAVSAADIPSFDQARWPGLPGPHNAQNIACAAAAARLLGLGEGAVERGLASFRPLAHRMQQVANLGGVRFVNDSKATNPASAAPALASFDSVLWIAGGRAKSPELEACRPYFERVKSAFLIGEAADAFATILSADGVRARVSGTLQRAVSEAAAAASPGDTVLLSPACASFDQFADFEA